MGINFLARTLAGLSTQGPTIEWVELGTVRPDLSIKVDRFPHPIPKGDYLVIEWTARIHLPAFSLVGRGEYPVDDSGAPIPPTSWTQQTRWDWRPREIDQVRIEIKPDLAPGNRVLCVWANGGTDLIVLGTVVTS